MKKIIIFLISLVTFFNSFAAIEEYTSGHLPLSSTNTFELFDNQYMYMAGVSSWPSEFTNYKVDNYVRIGYVKDAFPTATSDVSVNLKVDYWTYSQGTNAFVQNTEYRTLEISYDASDQVNTEDLSTFIFSSAHRISVQVLSVNGSGTPSNVYIESHMKVERYFVMPNHEVSSWGIVNSGPSNENITFHWNYIVGAEEYELEYVFLSDHDYDILSGSSTALPYDQIEYDFYKNSTRVIIKDDFYEIPAIFNRGYLIFRVRPIGRQGTNFEYRFEGDWNLAESGVVSGLNNTSWHHFSTDYDAGINWSSTVVYSENGKRVESVTYFDGLGRGRQAQSHNTVTDEVIVSNVYHDSHGRAVIVDKPSPVKTESFEHKPKFNLLANGTSAGELDAIAVTNLLVNTQNDCEYAPFQLSNTTGSGKYYSSNNTNTNASDAFIPDANGYGYQHVIFKNDPTGRVKTMGSYGEAHQLNGGAAHFSYGIPGENELHECFGSEVGYNQRYQKVYTEDPNDQTSIAYYDMRGRLIATSLSGSTPSSLDALSSNIQAPAETEVLYSGGAIPNGDLDPSPTVATYTEVIHIADGQDVTFSHSFDPAVFEDGCLPQGFCYDCKYEFTWTITDLTCASMPYLEHVTETINGGVINTICDGGGYSGNTVTLPLTKGSYLITKTLKVSESAAMDYWPNFIDNNDCLPSVFDFFKSLYDGTDFSCDEIELENSGSFCDGYRMVMSSQMAVGGQYGEVDGVNNPNEYTLSIYNESNQLPTGNSWRNPVGDYLNLDGSIAVIYLNDNNGTYSPEPAIGVTVSFDSSGNPYIHPEDLKHVNDFVYYAQPSWGDALVTYHPEYCYLEFCEQNNDYHNYTILLEEAESFDEACSNGLFSPLAKQTNPPTGPSIQSLGIFNNCDLTDTGNEYDEFFISGYYTTIRQWVNDNFSSVPKLTYGASDNMMKFYNIPGTSDYLSIWEYVVWQATCSGETNYSNIINCVNSATLDHCTKDLIWEIFRSEYIALRSQLYDIAMAAYVSYPSNLPGGGCGPSNNECIGNQSFSVFSMQAGVIDPKRHSDLTDLDNNGVISTLISNSSGPCATTTSELYDNMVSVFGNTTGMNVSIPSDPTAYISQQEDDMCQTTCEMQADEWMDMLSGCNMSANELASVRAGLIQVCKDGCDFSNPHGASTVANPGNGGFDSFQDVLSILLASNPNYESVICSNYLISDPQPYDQSLTKQLQSNLDACGCDMVLQAEYDLTNNPVTGVTTVSEMLMHNEGINFADADKLACACDQIYGDSPSWSPGTTWSASSIQTLTDASIKVAPSLTCTTNVCKPCSEVQTLYSDFTTKFGTTVEYDDNYEVLLTNYMNINLGLFLSFHEYETFLIACSSTSNEPTTALTTLTPVFEDMLDVITLKGQLTVGQGDMIDLATENVVYAYSNISKMFEGSNYWSHAGASNELVLNFGNTTSPSTITLTLPASADFAFEDVVSISTITPKVSCGSTDEFNVEVLAAVYGKLETRFVTGTSNDFDLVISYCGSNPNLTMCNSYDQFIAGNTCYEQKLLEISDLAISQYLVNLDQIQENFINSYNAKCAQGLKTEELTKTSYETRYHYTLFYYDQAGNLVKTIAPEGFDNNYNSVNAHSTMEGGIGSDIPNHEFATEYEYNSYNQLMSTTNPDQDGETKFWYDRFGRIVASQNPVQAETSTYGYSLYDDEGRPVEVGQITQTVSPLTENIVKADDSGFAFGVWMLNGSRTEITKTVYDAPYNSNIPGLFSNGQQENLRLRVASILYYSSISYWGATGNYESAVHYSYDQHGNVIEQIQDVPMMSPVNQDIKSTQYEFELLSGNVSRIDYQKGERDFFAREYKYDDLSRLTDVYVSTDDVHWMNDAQYEYFAYGPLARTELGEHRVQGFDYAYTINGWIKGMNSSLLDVNKDMGKDGAFGYDALNNTVNKNVARDVLAYTLGYYNGDYKTISGLTPELAYVGSGFDTQGREQFNGNIRNVISSIVDMQTMGSAYRYDQLYRLKEMKSYYESSGALNPTTDYYNNYSYDGNGNMLTLRRDNSGANPAMDNLSYHYDLVAGERSNRLNYVTDAHISQSPALGDIQAGQTAGNYTYDKIGQLLSDASEGISKMIWRTSDKKLKKIERNDPDSPEVEFVYNPFGQRVLKIVKPRNGGVLSASNSWKYTYYALEANGNVITTYDVTLGTTVEKATLKEQHIYGAKRLGIVCRSELLYNNGVVTIPSTDLYTNEIGCKLFEITNYLGNVNVIITDRKTWNQNDNLFEALLIKAEDYYPFGMVMPGRSEAYSSEGYRYAYNGMEQDNEVSGNGNSYTTEFRQYDPRLGRWKSLDPLMHQFPWMSPYVAFDNNPVFYIDPYGLSATNNGIGDGDDCGGGGGPEFTLDPNRGPILLFQRGDLLVNRDWETTKELTIGRAGVGGMTLNIPKGSSTNYYNDDNGDGFIGENGMLYPGVEKGQVKDFIGSDGERYRARWKEEGGKLRFVGYTSDANVKKQYANEKVDKVDLFEGKLKQGLEYMGRNAEYKRNRFKAPLLDYNGNFYLNSFRLDGNWFNGQVNFITHSWLSHDLNFEQRIDYMYLKDSGVNTAAKTLPEGFVVSFWTKYPGSYPYDALIVITFEDVNEWKRFVEYIHLNYGIDDNVPLTSKSLKPSEIIKDE